jgi:hypothetical protein
MADKVLAEREGFEALLVLAFACLPRPAAPVV